MTSVLTSASNAVTAVLDTVANTATSATRLVDGLGTGANMFQRMMNDLDSRHAMRSKLDNENYEEELLADYAHTIAERNTRYQAKMAEDQNYAKHFAEAHTKLTAILHPVETK